MGLDPAYVNTLIKQINSLHELIDKKLDFSGTVINTPAELAAINKELKEFEVWANGELSALSSKISLVLTESYKSVMDQMAAIAPLLVAPSANPGAIVTWIKSLITFFTKYYNIFLITQLEIIQAALALISAMTALVTGPHLNIDVKNNLTVYVPSLKFPPITYSDYSVLPAVQMPTMPTLQGTSTPTLSGYDLTAPVACKNAPK